MDFENAINLIRKAIAVPDIPEQASTYLHEAISSLVSSYVPIEGADAGIFDALPQTVEFKTDPMNEDVFVEKGMRAIIMAWEWDNKYECYVIDFNMKPFEEYNKLFLSECYYPNNITRKGVSEGKLEDKELYTADEAGMMESYFKLFHCVCVNDTDIGRDDEKLKEYLFNELLTPITRKPV